MKMKLFQNFGESLQASLRTTGTKLRQNRSNVGMAFGIVTLIAGTAWLCIRTPDAVKAVEEAKEEKQKVDEAFKQDMELAGDDKIRHTELRRVRNQDYLEIGWECVKDVGKAVGLPVLVWGSGLASVIWAHGEDRKDNKKLIIDSIAAKKLMDEYRERVKEKIGAEEEEKIYFDAKESEIQVEEIDPKTGNKKLVKKKGQILHENRGSKFARNFSKRTSYEFDVRSYADYFVELKIQDLNRKLKNVPFITMNEVYDALGMKAEYGRCADGLDWGWVYNPLDPDGPNEIVITRLEGWEEVFNDQTDKVEYWPCLRIDFNPQPLKGRI